MLVTLVKTSFKSVKGDQNIANTFDQVRLEREIDEDDLGDGIRHYRNQKRTGPKTTQDSGSVTGTR